MAMEEELSFLRQKVNRLEDMMCNLNSKIGDILEKFLNHRAGQLAGICKVLQEYEDVCLSLVAQLQSCIINGSQHGMHQVQGHTSQRSGRPTTTELLPTSGQRQQPKRVTRSSASAPTARTNVGYTSCNVAEDTLDGLHHTKNLADLSNSAGGDQEYTVTVKVEPLDENLETSVEIQDSEMLMQTPFEETEDADDNEGSESDPGGESDPDFQFYQSMKEKKERQRQRRGRKFVKKNPKFNRSFSSLVEARAQMRTEEKWATKAKSTAQNGKWQKYYCKCKVDYNCPVTMELWVDQESGTVSEYICGEPNEHVHQKKKNPQGLPKNVREVVDNIFFGGVTEFDVLYTELAKRMPDQTIPRRKARYYVERLREKKYGSLSFLKESKSKEVGNGEGSKSKSNSKSPKKRKREEISNTTDGNEGENEAGPHQHNQQIQQKLCQGITTA